MATRASEEEDRTQTMISIAKKAVEKFRRLCGRPRTNGKEVERVFDAEDLQQTALVELLRASEESFDEFFGTPFEGFCWGVAVSAVKNALIKSRSPVSTQHRTDRLKWINQQSLPSFYSANSSAATGNYFDEERGYSGFVHKHGDSRLLNEVHNALRSDVTPHDQTAHAELCAAVRERVESLVGNDGRDFAFAVFTNEWTPNEIAAAHGTDNETVYRLRRRVLNALRADEKLMSLWREL